MIEKTISNIIQSQFPSFYKEEGPSFIAFVRAYYEWLETQGGVLYEGRRLFDYRDIDKTPDAFLTHFKNKYLNNIQFETKTNKRLIVKHSLELHRAKGTERAFDLFFKLVYGSNASVYYPGDDIFRLDNSTWYTPRFIEVTNSPRILSLSGKIIKGHISSAEAFVESIIKKDGRILIYITDIKGNFVKDESIYNTTLFTDSPVILGSLSGVNIKKIIGSFDIGQDIILYANNGSKANGVVRSTDLQSILLKNSGFLNTNNSSTIISSSELSPVTLTNKQNTLVGSRHIKKIDGSISWTDTGPNSTQSYTGECFCSATSTTTSKAVFGLNNNPGVDLNYTSIQYGIFFDEGVAKLYEDGILVATSGAFTEDDIFSVEYSGTSVVYKKNGATIRTATTIEFRTFYFDTSLNTIDSIIDNIIFQPTKPIAYAISKSILGAVGFDSAYFLNNEGFLDDTKYLFDGEYYQEYSYEIRSDLSFEDYSSILKDALHVAGTMMFGGVILSGEGSLALGQDTFMEITQTEVIVSNTVFSITNGLNDGIYNTAYSDSIIVTGGTGPYTLLNLPTGLSGSGLTVTGTPT